MSNFLLMCVVLLIEQSARCKNSREIHYENNKNITNYPIYLFCPRAHRFWPPLTGCGKLAIFRPMIFFAKKKTWALFVCACLLGTCLLAKVHPADGSSLSQVHIMFEWDEWAGADGYELAVYQEGQAAGRPVLSQVVQAQTTGIAWLATKGLSFGQAYQWQVRAFKNKRPVFTSPRYNFNILESKRVKADSFKAEVRYAGRPGEGIVFLDRSAMAIDKTGKPVWFLPMPNDSIEKWIVRDLEPTASGTITHLDGKGAYEKDLTGRVLWQAPDDGRVSGGGREEYHHELKKNNDGTYLVCGSAYKQGKGSIKAAEGPRYNTLIHYDQTGKLLWNWDERESLLRDTFFIRKAGQVQGSHLNGFAFTHDGKQVFMSFKNLSDVLVYDTASQRFVSGLKQMDAASAAVFRQQHGPYLTTGQELLVYNNNIADKEDTDDGAVVHPTVLVFRKGPAGAYRLAWQWPVTSPLYPQGIKGKEGYVCETPAGNWLVCAGGAHYAVEVNRQKQKIWECYFYYRNGNDTTWKPYSNYRCQSATSLYPLYVTVQFVGTGNGQALFRLQNMGSLPGRYRVLFSGKNGQAMPLQASKLLRPGASQLFKVPLAFCQSGDFSCTVTPLHLAATAKTYQYKKL
jgi:hypothetical protein